MKILITGCRSQLGLELARQINGLEARHQLVLTDTTLLDITDARQVSFFLRREKPDVVINCAAYTNVDQCEKDQYRAFRVNALGADNLAVSSFKIGSKIIHISTDYVFDGAVNQPYREDDEVNPLNAYGKSKAFGEKLVSSSNPRHFILRTAWLYGEGNNFVGTMLNLAREKKEIDVVDDQYGTPTSTVDLAQCIVNIMKTEHYGTFHATCEGACSWWEFARRVFEMKDIPVKVNKIMTGQLPRPAARPKYSVLDNFLLKRLGINCFREWTAALEEYLKEGGRK
jgi:dTDP-4-dehydrorhamnose reductase